MNELLFNAIVKNCKSKQNLAPHYSDLISPTANDGIRVKCPGCNCSLKYQQDQGKGPSIEGASISDQIIK
jgi:hypothetical protein